MKNIIIIASIIVVAILIIFRDNKSFKTAKLTSEDIRTMSYGQLTDEDEKIENCDSVKFGGFFTKDLDGDGYAEKMLGTCKEIEQHDTLYIDLNVCNDGYLKDGIITINSSNIYYSMSMLKDTVLKNDCVSSNVKTIELNNVESGTQKLFMGQISSRINNKNSYTAINKITLNGVYVSNDGEETEISKTIDLTVDWYGTASTNISGKVNSYDLNNFSGNTTEDTAEIEFKFDVSESNKQLIVKENNIEVTIPDLLGYEATSASCDSNSEYDKSTHILKINKSTTLRKNSYVVKVSYPKEAYADIYAGYQLGADIKASVQCYNNNNEEFTNPYVSTCDTGKSTVLFEQHKGSGTSWGSSCNLCAFSCSYNRGLAISKQELLDQYNTQKDAKNMQYSVKWRVYSYENKDEAKEMVMLENKKEENYGDRFDSTIMSDYMLNTGIKFYNSNFFNENSKVYIYNNDTNELIKEFSYDEISSGKIYNYEKGIKHIRVETSAISLSSGTYLEMIHYKEVDNAKVMENFDVEEIEGMQTITSSSVAYFKGEESVESSSSHTCDLIGKRSQFNIAFSKINMNSTETLENEEIYISTYKNDLEFTGWKNGIFLVEIPENIINVSINEIKSNNADVKILGYDVYSENGKNFIKIFTENEEELGYTIVVNCNLTPDPRTTATSVYLNVYGCNENEKSYYNSTSDKYDLDGDEDITEPITRIGSNINISVPSSFITVETISEYDENGSVTISPNIAEIEKKNRLAKVNVTITNNYQNTAEGIKIIGKIPFEGNSYFNGANLNSEFTTTMTNTGITVPEELKNIAMVYYSENENPTEDLTNSENGWKLAENVNSFDNIKTYLIILKDYTLKRGESYEFSYNIKIPEDINCNLVSYSCHKVSYELNTDGGKLSLSVQPNRVGIRNVRYYNLKLMKYKENIKLGIQGAVYKIREKVESEEIKDNARLITSNLNGEIKLNNLKVNQIYYIEEIKAPNNYELNSDIIEFYINEKEDESLEVVVLSNNGFIEKTITKDEEGNDVLNVSVEDIPKYKINILKVDSETKEPLSAVRFEINGKDYITKNGKLTIENLSLNTEYTLKETYAKDYYCYDEIKFKLIKDQNNNLTFEENAGILKDVVVTNNINEDLIEISGTIEDEKIPTYNLEIVKIEENKTETKLANARFLLKKEDQKNAEYFTTDENGSINVKNLYQYVEGKNITGKYTLQEDTEPYGYVLNKEEINFTVSKNKDGKLEMYIENKDELDTVYSTESDGDNVKIIIQDKALFKVTKVDKETGEPLKNAEFIIYELNKETGKTLDYAKDANGEYVGNKNEDGDYIVITDETGTITVPLKNGIYKIIEVGYPEGYKKISNEEIFEISNGREINQNEHLEDIELEIVDDTTKTLEINNIEDLVELSNSVNTVDVSDLDGQNNIKEVYGDTTVKLMRDLDFNEDSSYKNPADTSYGDINGDGNTTGIKDELTNTNGCGFIPIGNGEEPTGYRVFAGIFDGQKHEIKNIYINRPTEDSIGLFGVMKNAKVKDFGITGTITGDCLIGGICGELLNYAGMENCYNKCNINGTGEIGGLIGYIRTIDSQYTFFKNCYNTGTINATGYHTGGLIGYSYIAAVYMSDCYNEGALTCEDSLGGLIGMSSEVNFKRCYNTGTINASGYGVGGLIGAQHYNLPITTDTNLEDCYNKGDIISTDGMQCGGIIGELRHKGNLLNCYNTGNISGDDCTGGIIGQLSSSNANVINCYNTGNISGDDYTGGIVGQHSGSSIEVTNCHNIGKIESSGSFIGGIAGSGNGKFNNSYNTGEIIAGNECVGGIIGEAYGKTIINSCYNKGNINIKKGYNVGGIVGEATDLEMYESYNTGDIVSIEKLSDFTYIGGLIGYIGDLESIGTVKKCYNSGNITIEGEGLHIGGICGSSYRFSFTESYNTGNINANATNYVFVGGISGTCTMAINNCYNTGDISCTSTDYVYAGGIVGERNTDIEITNVYNTGKIDVKAKSSKVGGIVGDSLGSSSKTYITNAYNTGNIYNQCSEDSDYCYVAGILGYGNNLLNNTYNMGSIYNNCLNTELTYLATNPIGFCGTMLNSYYLNSIEIIGKNSIYMQNNTYMVTPVDESYMKSEQMYNSFINNNEGESYWKYINGVYPILDIAVVSNLQEVTEVKLNNEKSEFNITTEIAENSSGERSGGTITGEYNEIYGEGNNIKFVETVSYGNSNSKAIEIIPDTGYKVSNIVINGKSVTVSEEENGKVILPVEYFKNISENKNIVVTFSAIENVFTINKVDENNNPVTGAIFKINHVYNDKITDELKEKVNQDMTYYYADTSKSANNLLGEVISNGQYYFEKQDDGTYVSNNIGVTNSKADSYIKIDLTNETKNYVVCVNAECSTGSINDNGYFIICDSESSTTGILSQVAKISKVTEKADYYSAGLVAGQVYYLHFNYKRYSRYDTATDVIKDTVTINNVNLYEANSETYNFINKDGKYVSNNQGKDDTYVRSYIPIDLTNKTGKYKLTVNAEISSQSLSDYGYATVTTTQTIVSETVTNGRFVYLTGNVAAQEYTTSLDGGKIYYLHLGYHNSNVNTNNGTDTFTINSVNLTVDDDDFLHEENIQTNANGKIMRELKYGIYEIVETQAPEGYELDSEPHIVVIDENSNNNLTVTNKKLRKVNVHYYEKGTGEEFEKEPIKIADNEVLYGNIGTYYSSNVYATVGGYSLITNENSEYVLPDNASGTYSDEEINVYYYYSKKSNSYTIEHYYKNKETGKYDLKYSEDKTTDTDVIESVSDKDLIVEKGYVFEKTEILPVTIKNNENNIIKVYYKLANYNYEIHYFYDGIEDKKLQNTNSAEYNDKITKYPEQLKQDYVFDRITPVNEKNELELTITENEKTNIINVYYSKEYSITTSTTEHDENHLDGTVGSKVKGGSISGENEIPYERLDIGGSNKKAIDITPDEGYQIVKILINKVELDYTNMLTKDGTVKLDIGYFTDMNESKYIEVEFRKITSVTSKYMDKETNEEIETGKIDIGYESKEFITEPKIIATYELDSITDQNGNLISETGNMYAENLIVTYWYNKIQAGIIERHIEITDNGEEKEIEKSTQKVKIGNSVTIVRKEYSGYESIDGPENDNEDIFVMKKDENSKEITLTEDKSIEIRFYYTKKKSKITVKYLDDATNLEIKTSDEYIAIVNENYTISRKQIEGYTLNEQKLPENEGGVCTEEDIIITYYYTKNRNKGEYELEVLYMVNNEKSNDAKVKIENDDHSVEEFVTSGSLYVGKYEVTNEGTDQYKIYETVTPKNNISVVTSQNPGIINITKKYENDKYVFDVKYNSIEGLSVKIDNNNKITIYLNASKIEKYNLAIQKFISAIDDVQLTDRIPNVEFTENGNVKYNLNNNIEQVSNEQKVTYTLRMYNESEVVAKGKRVIEYIPSGLVFLPDSEVNKKYNWNMYKADKDGKLSSTDKPEEATIVVTDDLVNKEIEGINAAENKINSLDVEVEFEVKESALTTTYRIIENKASIMPNENDEYPENDESIEKIYVKYFDLSVEKYIKEIKTIYKNTENVKQYDENDSNNLIKVDVKSSQMKDTTIFVTYGIKVTNIGEIAGYASKIADYMPTDFELVDGDNWKVEGEYFVNESLENDVINPGESKTIDVTFKWDLSTENVGLKSNKAEILKYTNDSNSIDINANNTDTADLLGTVKTGSQTMMYVVMSMITITIIAGGVYCIRKYIVKNK